MRDIKFKGVHPEVGFVMDVCVIDWMHDEVFFDQGSDVGYPIDKCKLMQFTGVKDKNGVEIYEGDILRDNSGKAGLVKYFESDAGFEVVDLCEITKNGWGSEEPAYELDTSRGWRVLKVIGNAYTPPLSYWGVSTMISDGTRSYIHPVVVLGTSILLLT